MYLKSLIENNTNQLIILSKPNCIQCEKLIKTSENRNISMKIVKINELPNDEIDEALDYIDEMKSKHEIKSYPITFFKNEYVGDYNLVIEKMHKSLFPYKEIVLHDDF